MTTKTYAMMDGNEATARIAHKVNEVIAIYPITPSSTMGEHADAFSAAGMTNIWGTVPSVYEMQSEGGAVGAVHGSLATGALTTTFTASQGLLLMIPNMYKIAGELTPTVFHVTARSIACQGLSIFGDHGDVMACRQTGFAMLSSNSVQEAHDFALIAQAATLEARVPFMHFFDGFRTSHEVNKIETIDDETIRAMIDDDLVMAHRARGLNPEKPTIRGTAQNPDVYFQGRETVNPYYLKTPEIVQKAMDKLGGMTGRNYKIYEYVGAPDADRIIVIMGSGAETVHEVAEYLNAKGEKVGLVKVRLFRPFSAKDFIKAFPKTTKKVAVMDRTKEPGAAGEPLYIDVRNSIGEAMEEGLAPFTSWPKVVGGRYGLGSKDFTPDQVIAIYDNLKADKPKNHFTVGIIDDVCNTSLPMGEVIETGDPTTFSAMFYGMGSDGTVGANKDSIKVIGTNAKDYAQGYFVYDSKKSGSMTISHLRFGDKPLHCPYLISHADFVACHNFSFIEKYNMVKPLKKGGNFLLETEYSADEVWEHLPVETQEELIKKQAKLYVIDANKLAREIGLGGRINIIMQTCFFKISEDKIMPEEKFKELQKKAVKKTYGKKGDEVVKMNCDAIDKALENLHEVKIPAKATSTEHIKKSMHVEDAPAEIKELVSGVLEPILAGNGDAIKVSQMPDDGTYPTGTSQLEKRNVGLDIPVWNPEACAQCGQCSAVCPHAAIRMKIYEPKYAEKAPATFKSVAAKAIKDDMKFTLQVAAEDCTGCGLCVGICPLKAKGVLTMAHKTQEMREAEAANWKHFTEVIPETDRKYINLNLIKGSQLVKPLIEFSGACAGCGETAYIKLLTQICGDRLMIANATGCSSIYGANLPTTPYCKNEKGHGPAWANSLFEDNAEFGLGMRLAADKMMQEAKELLKKVLDNPEGKAEVKAVAEKLMNNPQKTAEEIEAQRGYVAELKKLIGGCDCKCDTGKRLAKVADYLIKRSVWVIGGDGWAYDIGYGGLDHVLASGKNIKVLVLDTEVYSNTGGQMSKATPIGAVAKFADSGKTMAKKDLGMIAMTYENIYVGKISLGGDMNHALKTMNEAEAYDGPALIIAYAHCINHGINMTKGLDEQKLAVQTGHWPLYRFNPELRAQGKNPLTVDYKEPTDNETINFRTFAGNENRFKQLLRKNPEGAKILFDKAQQNVKLKYALYKQIADIKL